MEFMSVVLDTSHLEMSPLNDDAAGMTRASNNLFISVTDSETSHDPIRPCGPLEQSEFSFRHSRMAAWSSHLDSGAHSVVGYCVSGDA